MKNKILFLLLRLNLFYPWLLGFNYYLYRKNRLIKHNLNFHNSDELLNIVNNAISIIPYYKNKYKNKLSNIVEFESTVSFIDKDLVMNNWDEFLLPNYKKNKTIEGTTGGTSGKPLRLVLPRNRFIFELATMYKMWEVLDWKGEARAILRNAKFNTIKTYKVDPVKKEVVFDGFKSTDEHYQFVYDTFIKLNLKFLHAYPSSIYQFALFLDRKKLDTTFIKGVFCGSEAFLPEQENLIVNKLGLNVFSWYGHSEKLVLGGRCENNEAIHIEPSYGYFELIDEKGNVINKKGEIGEIVGTTLHNKYMPLIRYKTGDFAEFVGDYCEDCKRSLPLIKNIQGRWEINNIYLNDNSYVSVTALNLHSDEYNHIEGMQYVQYEKGKLEIKIIKSDSFSVLIEEKFITHFKAAFNGKCSFKLNYVDKIEKETNGKFLTLKQYIKE
ncbi:hypothetical protein [uncultured Winogradskyella sp.]|uniref:hypothetical protein n=1 Tax=uncultured Winogradskyella sp. TaxID=395353 RepID=UPI0030DC5E52|tara:strand:- start:13307 stop:14623 length:1317 start_codon:yes stop_codon:yes gene_type:complete